MKKNRSQEILLKDLDLNKSLIMKLYRVNPVVHKSKIYIKICYRCEYRANFHEIGNGPRFECSQVGSSVGSCYMFQPVRPPVMQANLGDTRPIFGPWVFSARAYSEKLADMVESVKKVEGGYVRYWKFAESKKKK